MSTAPTTIEAASTFFPVALDPADPSTEALRSRWPVYEEDEIAAVVDVLRSGQVNSLVHGRRCRAFEMAFANLCDMPHAIAMANGTVALEVALKALGIGPGDDVIVTARSFVASASCVVACGARPIFVDVDPISQNIDPDAIARTITGRTRAIVAVHLAGYPCAMEELGQLAKGADLKLIEDCAQAHGATYRGRPVGGFGDAAVFSFCTDKIMSTGGEGGMLLLRDHQAWQRAWSLKDHGKDQRIVSQRPTGEAFRWLHASFGSNYRMTEMQAAIGLCQLAKLPRWLAARRRNAALLFDVLSDLPALRLVHPAPDIGHAYYKFYAFLRPERLRRSWSRDRIIAEAVATGVPCQSGTCPEIYCERAFVDSHLRPERPLPVAHFLGTTSLMLPVDHTLDDDDMWTMGQRLRHVLDAASR